MSDAADLMNAIAALKMKHSSIRFVTCREGTEIIQPGRPVLLLTWDAVHRFANERQEAIAND